MLCFFFFQWDHNSIVGPWIATAHEMGHNFGMDHDEGRLILQEIRLHIYLEAAWPSGQNAGLRIRSPGFNSRPDHQLDL